jgi:hypothetical protein
MVRVEEALDAAQDGVGKGERDRALRQYERALLVQPAEFGEKLREGFVVTRITFRASKNQFPAHIPTREQRLVRSACERFHLRDGPPAQLFHDDRESARIVPEGDRYQAGVGCELDFHRGKLLAGGNRENGVRVGGMSVSGMGSWKNEIYSTDNHSSDSSASSIPLFVLKIAFHDVC